MTILMVLELNPLNIIIKTYGQPLTPENEDSSAINSQSPTQMTDEFGPLNATSSITPGGEEFGPLNATSSITPGGEESRLVNATSSITPGGEESRLVNITSSIRDAARLVNATSVLENISRSITPSEDISLSINTDRSLYVSDQVVVIFGKVVYIGNSQSPTKITLEVRDVATNLPTYKSAKIISGQYIFRIHPGAPGSYNATVSLPDNAGTDSASTLFRVTDLFETRTAVMFYISIGFLAGLLLLLSFGTKSIITGEVLRFVFLSGIVGSILAAFVFTDLQVGNNSPLGLVIKFTNQTKFPQGQWVLNIGGDPGNYTGGIQIPVYVLVFGLAGGYLRYLYKTSRLLTDPELKRDRSEIEKILRKDNNTQVKIGRLLAFYQSLKDIALFFLAPLLALATWFILVQWQTTENAVYTLAVVSFAAGLMTDEIVDSIIRFTKRLLRESTSKGDEAASKGDQA